MNTRAILLSEQLEENDVLQAIIVASSALSNGNASTESDIRRALLEAAARHVVADAVRAVDGGQR